MHLWDFWLSLLLSRVACGSAKCTLPRPADVMLLLVQQRTDGQDGMPVVRGGSAPQCIDLTALVVLFSEAAARRAR